MIGYLSGTVHHKGEKQLILEVQGVGYEVMVPTSVMAEAVLHAPLTLYVHTHVREDAFLLFGFPTLEIREFFLAVTSVSGIGPKLGMEIVASPLDQVKNAIVSKDIAFLTSIPGIGKKTAERMAMELAGKVDGLVVAMESHSPSHGDIIQALENLGYRSDSIRLALKHMPKEISTEEEIIKYCLKVL